MFTGQYVEGFALGDALLELRSFGLGFDQMWRAIAFAMTGSSFLGWRYCASICCASRMTPITSRLHALCA